MKFFKMKYLYRANRSPALNQLFRICYSTESVVPGSQMFQRAKNSVTKSNFRLFMTSSACCTKERHVSYKFNEYYAAVEEAAQTNERFLVARSKYMKEEDPDEQERALRQWKFIEAVDFYIEQNKRARKRHVEFIYDALKQMKKYGVERDLACYKALVKVFPEDVMVATTVWQVEFLHFPKQQHCGIEIIETMEDNGVLPDIEFGELCVKVFGESSHVIRKFRRTLYWMRKFQNKNPYKLPHHLPFDPIKLALLALKKMAVDLNNELEVWKVKDDSAGSEGTFIASAQSQTQRDMIEMHPVDTPLYVEGRFTVWLRDVPQTYFILRADSDPKLFEVPEEDVDDLCEFETIFDSEDPKEIIPRLNDHQQEEGTILGMCVTGTSTKDSLISWIRCLQQKNPKLEKIPIIFSLRSAEEAVVPVTQDEKTSAKVVPT